MLYSQDKAMAEEVAPVDRYVHNACILPSETGLSASWRQSQELSEYWLIF